MKLILPILLGLIGLGAGLGAGIYLNEPAPTDEAHEPKEEMTEKANDDHSKSDKATADYIKLNNQFVVPLIVEGNVVSLVVLSLSLEVDPGNEEMIYSREPKVRDAFLRVLFDHANAGGFSGDFTRSTNMIVLRDSLLEIARKTLGDVVQTVLIVDLVRQDI